MPVSESADRRGIRNRSTAGQQAALQAQADAGADPEKLTLENGPLKRFSQQVRRDAYIRNVLAAKAPADA